MMKMQTCRKFLAVIQNLADATACQLGASQVEMCGNTVLPSLFIRSFQFVFHNIVVFIQKSAH